MFNFFKSSKVEYSLLLKATNLNILNKANKFIFTKNIDFEIHSHSMWRLIGENGIGKSSFFESLLGTRPINQGEVFFKEHNLMSVLACDRAKIGMKIILQNNLFFENLSILDNLKIFAEYLVDIDERKDIVDYAINTFHLSKFVHKSPKHLSGGQKRLSELSKMVIGPNDLILLDEPFAAIDHSIIDKLIEIFALLKERGKSFLVNDHNIASFDSITDVDIIMTPETKIKVKTAIKK